MPTPALLPPHFDAPIDALPWPEAPGLARRDDVVAVLADGIRIHGKSYEAMQIKVTRWLQDISALRMEAEAHRELYVPSAGATSLGGIAAEMELLEVARE